MVSINSNHHCEYGGQWLALQRPGCRAYNGTAFATREWE
jgi:hypothetical protein